MDFGKDLKAIVVAVAVGVSFAEANAKVRYVAVGGTGDGSSWAAASSDLQAAIDASEAGDEVWVKAGTYKPTKLIKENKNRSYAFILKSGVSLYGGFAGLETSKDQRALKAGGKSYEFAAPTVLSADDDVPDVWTREFDAGTSYRYVWNVSGNEKNSNHVVYNNTGLTDRTEIDGFTMKGAFSDVYQAMAGGAAVYVKGWLELRNCIFTENVSYNKIEGRSYYGGAVALISTAETEGKAVVENCLFDKNQTRASHESSYGGGLYMDKGSVRNCEFRGCVSFDNGGALYNNGGTVENCSFDDCYAGTGGAVYNEGGVIANCTVLGCRSLSGGGIYNESDGEVKYCKVANCYAEAPEFSLTDGVKGGGIYCGSGLVLGSVVYNCTSYHGGGIYLSTGRIVNCTVQHNDAPRNAKEEANVVLSNFVTEEANVLNTISASDVDDSNFEKPTSFKGFTSVADSSAEIASASWALAEGSSFIDKGTKTEGIDEDVDIAVNKRVQGSSIDVGAYESSFVTGIEKVGVAGALRYDAASERLIVSKPSEVRIFTMGGQLVLSVKTDSAVSLGTIPSGMYVASVAGTDGDAVYCKFVKR